MLQAEKHAAMEEAEGFHEDVTGVTFQARSNMELFDQLGSVRISPPRHFCGLS